MAATGRSKFRFLSGLLLCVIWAHLAGLAAAADTTSNTPASDAPVPGRHRETPPVSFRPLMLWRGYTSRHHFVLTYGTGGWFCNAVLLVAIDLHPVREPKTTVITDVPDRRPTCVRSAVYGGSLTEVSRIHPPDGSIRVTIQEVDKTNRKFQHRQFMIELHQQEFTQVSEGDGDGNAARRSYHLIQLYAGIKLITTKKGEPRGICDGTGQTMGFGLQETNKPLDTIRPPRTCVQSAKLEFSHYWKQCKVACSKFLSTRD